MKRLAALLLSLMLLALVPSSATGYVGTDPRCNFYYGVTLYEHAGYDGAQITFCNTGGPGGSTIAISNLSNYTTGLGFGANWNDRASAYQVFNSTAGKVLRFYTNSGYSVLAMTQTGPGNVPNMHNGYNAGDKVTSIRTP